MCFDFDTFSRIAAVAYRNADTPYSLEDALKVFQYFFQRYEEMTGDVHPNIKLDQIKRIMETMPYLDKEYAVNGMVDIDVDSYPALIDAYFRTDFDGCNYRINHFFSGRIRELRFYEELY